MSFDLPFFDDRHRALAAGAAASAPAVEAVVAGRKAAGREAAGEEDEAGRAALRVCAEHGWCRLLVPRDAGGDGFDLRSLCVVREALAAASGLADSVFAVQGLGSYPIGLAGPGDLARRFLPGVAEAREIGAFALTETGAGSDASAIATRAVRDGAHYVLDGEKTFISNATIASFFVVFARTSDTPKRAISAFVVEAKTPGLTVAPLRVSAPHPIGTVALAGCRVPATHRLGEEGDGMRIALATLDFFRTSVGAAACGLGRRALDEAMRHATARVQFGSRLADFQLTQAALADMATELEAARLLVYRAAWLKDHGRERVTAESAMAKLFATEAAQRIVDRAVQIHGGLGVVCGSVVERLYREVRAPRIYEGTSEIQRLVIARQLLA